MCETFHVLPNEGGLFDQNPKHVRRLIGILNIFEEYRKEEISGT